MLFAVIPRARHHGASTDVLDNKAFVRDSQIERHPASIVTC
jgi:hypothetical protein